jgi:hypothetical protein
MTSNDRMSFDKYHYAMFFLSLHTVVEGTKYVYTEKCIMLHNHTYIVESRGHKS